MIVHYRETPSTYRNRPQDLHRSSTLWKGLAVGFGISFVTAGIPYWRLPHSEAALPDALMGPGLIFLVLVAFVLRLHGRAGVGPIALTQGAVLPAVVALRVVVEFFIHPGLHPLWPLEIGFAIPMSLLCAFAGAGLGHLYPRKPFGPWRPVRR